MTVSFGNAADAVSTDADGEWERRGLNGTVTVTPTHAEYTFEPASREVSEAAGNVDFTGVPLPAGTYTVSGVVTDDEGDPVPGVALQLEYADLTAQTTTDEEGRWEYADLFGEVSVTAIDPAYHFPTSPRTLSAAATDVDFEGELRECNSGDSTTKDDPCVVTRIKQVEQFEPAGHYAQGADIDASATRGWHDGRGFEPIGTSPGMFGGSFDGAGHTITNLFIDRPDRAHVGLFGYAREEAEIERVHLTDADITGGQFTGALAGLNAGTIRDSTIRGAVSGTQDVGGLVGRNSGSISDSASAGEVSGSGNYVGGLVGNNRANGSVIASRSSSSVTGSWWVGGLVGTNGNAIERSYSAGSATGESRVGGLSGGSTVGSRIVDSYSWAPVTSTGGNAGGLVGFVNSGTITTSYSTGLIENAGLASTGGFLGYDHQGEGVFSGNYWDEETSGMTTSLGADPKTTSELMQRSTYENWDFDDVWSIEEGGSYPDLQDNPR